MDEQIEVLLRKIGDLVKTLQNMNLGAGTDRLVAAINVLNKNLTVKGQSDKAQAKAMVEFSREVEKAGKAAKQGGEALGQGAEQAADALKDYSQEQKENLKLLRQHRDSEEKRQNIAAQLAREQAQAAKAAGTFGAFLRQQAGESVTFQKTVLQAESALATLGNIAQSGAQFAGALAKGETKFTTLNPIIDSLSKAFGGLLESIPLVGGILSGTIKMAAEGFKFMLEQLQVATESFQQISEVGGLTAQGMSGIQQQFLQSGMSLQGFRKAVTENAQTLARFGGTVGRGAEDFSRIVGEILDSDVGDRLRRLGFSADSFGETTAQYIAMQTRLGLAQGKTNQQLAQSAAAYAQELDGLARLTGQSRQAAQKQIDAALSEARFRSTIEKMNAAGQTQGAKTLTFFQNQVSSINDELGQAIRDVSSGIIDSDAVLKFVRAGVDLSSIVEGVKSEQLTAAQAAELLQRQINNVKDAQIDYAQYIKQSESPFFDLAKALEFARADISASGEIVRKDQKALADGTDALTNDTMNAQKSMEQMSRQMGNFAFSVMPAAAKAVSGFTGALNQFIQGVAKATGIELPTITQGGSAGGGGAAAGTPGRSTPGGGATTSGGGGRAGNTTAQGPRAFAGGIMGAIENLVTGGTGFRSYAQGGAGNVDKILDYIGNLESRGNYNILVGGKTKADPPLTEMTVGQVLDFQRGMIQMGHESTAVGKYQIIRDTLASLFQQGVVSYSDKFDQSTQDKLAVALLRRRGLDQYQSGQLTADQFANSLAKEWASLPTETGQSYYQGKGSNKAGASRQDFMSIFAAQGFDGVISGPKSGYTPNLIMHGTERLTVTPESNNMTDTVSKMERQSDILSAQIVKMDEMISAIRDGNQISGKILQATQSLT